MTVNWKYGVSRTATKRVRMTRKSAVIEEPVLNEVVAGDEDGDDGALPFPFPFPKNSKTLHSSHNNVYFNDDITNESAFELNRELRDCADKMRVVGMTHRSDPMPIWLHLTTNGGSLHAAMSIIDCMREIQRDGVKIYTVVDGFVASAGTLISVMGDRRYMNENAYMLIHELRSAFWGKMSDIKEEVGNLDKMMAHILRIYAERTRISKKSLEKLLSKDAIWDARECTQRGLVDEVR